MIKLLTVTFGTHIESSSLTNVEFLYTLLTDKTWFAETLITTVFQSTSVANNGWVSIKPGTTIWTTRTDTHLLWNFFCLFDNSLWKRNEKSWVFIGLFWGDQKSKQNEMKIRRELWRELEFFSVSSGHVLIFVPLFQKIDRKNNIVLFLDCILINLFIKNEGS